MYSTEIEVRTGAEAVVHDLTHEAESFLVDTDAMDGLLHVWVPHATAGLAVIETGSGSDEDLLARLTGLLPLDNGWRHQHGSPGTGVITCSPRSCRPTRRSRCSAARSRSGRGSRSA